MAKFTPLYQAHQQSGARLIPFAGWEMPLHYGSQLTEHQQVRQDVGVFDVSHMTQFDINGKDAAAFLSRLLANDLTKLPQAGRALYSCMLNPEGGIIDDLIVYWLESGRYRLVSNAATRERVTNWLQQQQQNHNISIQARDDLAMLAIQGPHAITACQQVLPELQDVIQQLPRFACYAWQENILARTGYTGEDGFEWMLPTTAVNQVWSALLQQGVKPIGLGARDSLRLEAGMLLYGQDMDEHTSPLVCGLDWTLGWQHEFIGRQALQQQQAAGITEKQVGLLLLARGVLRHGQRVCSQYADGIITSGGFAPSLQGSIALARVPIELNGECQVEIRDKLVPARLVNYPFVRNGKVLIPI